MGGLGLALALVLVAHTRGLLRIAWLAVVAVIPTMYALSGTRTSLTLLAVLLGVVGHKRAGRSSVFRLLGILSVVALAIWAVLPLVTAFAISDPHFLSGRFASALSTIQNGVGSDSSGQERLQSYSWAMDAWRSDWVFGTGFGHAYPNGLLSLDTPLMIPSKLGVIGTIAVIAFLASIAMAVWRIRREWGPAPANSAARAFFLFLLVLTPFLPITEDKGLPLAIALLIAAVASEMARGQLADAHQTIARRAMHSPVPTPNQ